MNTPDYKGHAIVITGASSGFGRGFALALADTGADLVLAARREDVLDELVGQCTAKGVRALAVPTDVGSPEEVDNLARQAVGSLGKVTVWINNAGVGAIGRFEDIPLDDHRKIIETNLIGTIYGSHAALNQFKRQGNAGILINIASEIGRVPAPYYASYVASKHGVVGLSAAIRQELAVNDVRDIHVCTVNPTEHDTPFFQHAGIYTGHQLVPERAQDPHNVVEVVVKLIGRPRDEVTVGSFAKVMAAAHGVVPGLVETMAQRATHKELIEHAPPGPRTEGSIHEPKPVGTAVSGGWQKK